MSETLVRPQAPWALRPLPPFPAVAQRIMALAKKEDPSVRELGDLVKMDPSFSGELLRLANSALFGVPREVTSLARAIMIVGTDRIKTMAATVAVNRMVRASMRIGVLRKVWVHSLVTAIVAEEAARTVRLDRDAGYTAGLMHNLGTLGLMAAYPEEYSRMLEDSGRFGFDLLQTERDLFEIDHCAAGAYLAQDWDFPDELAAVIATHHENPVPGETSQYNLIKVCWRISDLLGYGAFPPEKPWTWDELTGVLPHAGSSWLGESREAVKAKVAKRLADAPM